MDSKRSLGILVVPNLRSSAVKASRMIEEKNDVHTLFLHEPQNIETYVRRYSEGRISFEAMVEEVRNSKLVPEPIGSWLYTSEPILRALPRLHRQRGKLSVFCYQDTDQFRKTSSLAADIALLTYRATAVGKIDIKEWMDLLSDFIETRRLALPKDAQYIQNHSCESGNLCLHGLGVKQLKSFLDGAFEKIEVRCVESFYRFTPLEMLYAKLSRRAELEGVEELVKSHLQYVNRYVLRNLNRDIAHYRWLLDREPSLRNKIPDNQVEQMRVL